MRLQKATLCALYAVLELAREPDRQVSAAEIAETHGISANHLAKVLRDLARARMVESMRGAGGGYRFSGNVKRITLYEVISLFENLETSAHDGESEWARTEIGQALDSVMREIDEIARATLKSITLATLLKTLPGSGEGPRESLAAPVESRAE